MREIKIEPATIVDLAEMASIVGASRDQWGDIRSALSEGDVWTLRAGDIVIGIAGIQPIGESQGSAWFHFRREAAPFMRQVVRAIRLTISAAPYRAIVTLCTSEAGKRVARAAGFAFVQSTAFGEVWAYGRVSGYADGRCAAPPATGHAECAEHDAGTDGGAAG